MPTISKNNETVKVKTLCLKCDDVCETLVVDRYFWNDEKDTDCFDVSISINDKNLLHKGSFLQRIKMAVKFIFEKPVCCAEICISDKNELINFADKLKELANEKE